MGKTEKDGNEKPGPKGLCVFKEVGKASYLDYLGEGGEGLTWRAPVSSTSGPRKDKDEGKTNPFTEGGDSDSRLNEMNDAKNNQ